MADWRPALDPSTNRKYWYNTRTQETTWEDPEGEDFECRRAVELERIEALKSGTKRRRADVEQDNEEAGKVSGETILVNNNETIKAQTKTHYKPKTTSTLDTLLARIDAAKSGQQPISLEPVVDVNEIAALYVSASEERQVVDYDQDQLNEPTTEYEGTDEHPAEHAEKDNETNTRDYIYEASFNLKTGKFTQAIDSRHQNPQEYFSGASKGMRQMEQFFSFDQYQAEAQKRMQDDSSGRKEVKKVKTSDVKRWKERNKERKLEKQRKKWLD